ncbi:MAG: flavin reductase family protein [Deltaproteobacteria bacterium]|nr:flavin reductase family protein [Deltaproteobacteria bacterium]
MAIDPRELRNVFGAFATGVTIITTKDATGKPFGLTANSYTSLSLDPPLVLVCVDKKVDCYACFDQSKVFVVNILSEGQDQLSTRFATKGIEKFEGVAVKQGSFGVPLLDGALGYLECKVTNGYEGGDHTIYVGEVQTASVSDSRPLLFFKGKYQKLPQN